ncbi:ABC transporter F family member 3-like [Lycium ferocissimum]|uniref:ABC transporter F family member 3-like n=1 Tax=Lycium ferocissimum TaxID=112874 RepID=UPI0028166F96|nr:ABC transporter F family member 3-like [Lycium ferocissimum]
MHPLMFTQYAFLPQNWISLPSSLSGQKSRVAFANITFKKPHILFLDELSDHLDLDAVEALTQGLVLFQRGVLMVSHDEHLTSGTVDQLWPSLRAG